MTITQRRRDVPVILKIYKISNLMYKTSHRSIKLITGRAAPFLLAPPRCRCQDPAILVVQKRLSGPTFYIVFALLKAILGLFWGN